MMLLVRSGVVLLPRLEEGARVVLLCFSSGSIYLGCEVEVSTLVLAAHLRALGMLGHRVGDETTSFSIG